MKIDNPDLISEIFDTVSYEKGSFLIRMMGLFLGKESLKEGVNSFLKEHKYGNADQDDLWRSLTTAAHRNKALSPDMTVNTIMDSWTLQTGYPVVTVTRNYADGTAILTQVGTSFSWLSFGFVFVCSYDIHVPGKILQGFHKIEKRFSRYMLVYTSELHH